MWLTIAAATGQLALGLLAARHAARSPVALVLACLCLTVFGWTACDLAYQNDGQIGWHILDHTLSPFTAPLVLHLTLVFTGRRRRYRWALAISYVALGALAASAPPALVSAALHDFQWSTTWDEIHVALALPICALSVTVLMQHLREPLDPDSRRRTWLVLCAFAVGIPLAMTELLPDVPPLADIGTLGAVSLVAVVALRLRLFGEDLSTSTATLAVGVAALIIFFYAAVYNLLVLHTAALVLATASAALLVGWVVRHALGASAARRARAETLVTFGRFAAQVAHDLRNPLAALKGAAQLLVEEGRRGTSLESCRGYFDLIQTQVERLQVALDDLARLSRIEPAPSRLDANELLGEIADLARLSAGGVTTRIEPAASPLPVSVDRDLVIRALENLVKNAAEAMPDGGTLAISAALVDGDTMVEVAVADTGCGMDAATCERAADDFFTTKANGSGLGLSFCRRVALAHKGDLRLSSRRGGGTVARLWLPVYRGLDGGAGGARRGR